MKNVPGPQVLTPREALERPLPAEIQEALGELVGAAREGLLALSVGVGLSVVHELMEAEVSEVVGPKGRHNPDRTAKRHGHERGSMTLGGRRVEVRRPRVRTADDERELPVKSYEYFADRDPLTCVVMNRMLAGVSTRKYAGVGEPVGEEVERESSSTGKSTVSELFIERTRTALGELMGWRRRLRVDGIGPTPWLTLVTDIRRVYSRGRHSRAAARSDVAGGEPKLFGASRPVFRP